MVPNIIWILSFKKNQKKEDGKLAIKTKRNRVYHQKIKAEHGVLLNCNDEGKDRRRKIHYVLFSIGQQGRDVFNTMTWKKKKNAKGNPRLTLQ